MPKPYALAVHRYADRKSAGGVDAPGTFNLFLKKCI